MNGAEMRSQRPDRVVRNIANKARIICITMNSHLVARNICHIEHQTANITWMLKLKKNNFIKNSISNFYLLDFFS